jgi:hypothetical protein
VDGSWMDRSPSMACLQTQYGELHRQAQEHPLPPIIHTRIHTIIIYDNAWIPFSPPPSHTTRQQSNYRNTSTSDTNTPRTRRSENSLRMALSSRQNHWIPRESRNRGMVSSRHKIMTLSTSFTICLVIPRIERLSTGTFRDGSGR